MVSDNQVVITQAEGGFAIEVNGRLYVVNNLRKALALVKDVFGEDKGDE